MTASVPAPARVAVVLAGGRSRRLGHPKEDVVVDGRTLLERTVTACAALPGVRRVVVVGPPRTLAPCVPAGPGSTDAAEVEVVHVREEPPHGGPVAALAAALAALDGPEELVVVACDMPRVAEVLTALDARGPLPDAADAFVAVDRDRHQPLAARYRRAALARELAREPAPDRSVRSVLAGLRVVPVAVPPGACDDVDTPEDAARLAGAAPRRVRDAMLTIPTLLPATATLDEVRAFLADDHVHLAVLVEDGVVVTTLDRGDLVAVAHEAGDAPARPAGRLRGRTTPPDARLRDVADRMVAEGTRRRVVVDDRGRLLGLLCLKRSLGGFCRDDDVRARREQHEEQRVQPLR